MTMTLRRAPSSAGTAPRHPRNFARPESAPAPLPLFAGRGEGLFPAHDQPRAGLREPIDAGLLVRVAELLVEARERIILFLAGDGRGETERERENNCIPEGSHLLAPYPRGSKTRPGA